MNLKKNSLLFAAVVSSFSICLAQSSVWEVNKDGNILYLGGSIHTLRAEDFPLPKEFDKAFDQSKMLVLEADIEQAASPEASQKLMTKAMLPDDETLQTILDEDTYKKLEAKCNELSLPIASLMKLKPSMVATILTMLKMQQLGFTPQGVDTYYLTQAKEKNKKIDFLESLDFQIELIANLGTEYENEYIQYTVEELDNTEKEMAQLLPDWKNGTSTYVETAIAEIKNKFPKAHNSTLKERNNAWLPKIENYLSNKTEAFVVVGLMHLLGKDGLLAQLQHKGYIVKQVQ
jgi:uncharacterized protein YbaP (TraB family)